MPIVRQEGYLALELDVEGLVPDPDVEAAMRRAQEKSAIIVEQEVKDRARMEMANSKTDPDRDPRNRGDYPGSMVDYYNADVDGLTIVLDNPTARADYFEFGTVRHEIWASGLGVQGSGRRGLRGQFTRGARSLRFNMQGSQRSTGRAGTNPDFISMVNHPGQDAKLVMYETMGDLMDVMAENILDELEEEFARG